MLGSSERVLPPIPDPTMLTQNETLFEALCRLSAERADLLHSGDLAVVVL